MSMNDLISKIEALNEWEALMNEAKAEAANIRPCCSFILLSPWSYSIKISSAPAAFSSRTWRVISCLLSLVEQRAYP